MSLYCCDSSNSADLEDTLDQMISSSDDLSIEDRDHSLDYGRTVTDSMVMLDSFTDLDGGVFFENIEEGQPLNPEIGLYPYPSDFFLKEDAQSVTGFRVELPAHLIPPPMPSEAFKGHDGFSRMPMILSAWPRGVDPLSLPDSEHLGESITDESSTLILRHETISGTELVSTRVPHIAELDLTTDDPLRRALIMRPAKLLEPNSTYTVAIRSSLRDLEGVPYQSNEAYHTLRRALETGRSIGYPPLDQQIESLSASRRVIESNGLNFDDYILVWSFKTRSREQLTTDLLALQNKALDWPLGEYVVTEEINTSENLIIRGEIDMPRYAGDHGLERDDNGDLKIIDVARYPFSMAIPSTVTEPRPVILYGHGFLGDHPQATRSSFNELCVRGQMSAIGLNFGMHGDLLPILVQALTGDLNAYHVVRAEVMQTMVNYSVMTRYIKDRLSLDFPQLNPNRSLYMGISNGGTFGYLYSATSKLVSQAVLVVGGGGLSHFLQRATQWRDLSFFITREISDPLKLQLFLSMLQDQLDPIDPINYVDRLITPRFEGRLPLRAQLHMAVNDSQVHNMVTEWVARSAKIPLLTPSPKMIWGLDTLTTPLTAEQELNLPSAMYVYDEQLEPYLGGNLPPLEDNGTHATVRRLDSYQRHIIDFINEGRINQVCDGACDPE